MNAHYKTYSISDLHIEIDKATQKTLQEYKDDLYEKVEWDCFQQALAC